MKMKSLRLTGLNMNLFKESFRILFKMIKSSMHLKPTSIAVDSKIELGEMQNAFPPLASVHSLVAVDGVFKVISIDEENSKVTAIYSENDLTYEFHVDVFDLLFSKPTTEHGSLN